MSADWADEAALEILTFVTKSKFTLDEAAEYLAEHLRITHAQGRIDGEVRAASCIQSPKTYPRGTIQ